MLFQIAMRNRIGRNRANTDENAVNKQVRQGAGVPSAASRPTSKDFVGTGKASVVVASSRPALGEVTAVNVPRKVSVSFHALLNKG
jgi:hypothetical protein